MPKKYFKISLDEIGRQTSCYTIGFAKLSAQGNIEDATCAGSGTLVTIGSLHGILTAAHVLEAFPKNGPIGIVTNVENTEQFKKQVIRPTPGDLLMIGGEKSGVNGPDLGFVRLAEDEIGWFKAQNSFYNLAKHRPDALANKWVGNGHQDTVAGMIGALTKDVPGQAPGMRKILFTGLFWTGYPIKMRYVGHYDIVEFKPSSDSDEKLPDNFKGTSGGSIWRHFVAVKGGKPEVAESRLIGVPFQQTDLKDNRRNIIYHGPRSIYGVLFDQIIAKWPNETKS